MGDHPGKLVANLNYDCFFIAGRCSPMHFPPGRAKLATKPAPTGSGKVHEYDRDRPRLPLECSGRHSRVCDNHIGLQIDQLFGEHPKPISVAGGPAIVDPDVATSVHPRLWS